MQKNYDKELMLNSEQFSLKARSQDFNKQHEEAALKNTLNQAPLAAVNREFQRITKVKASSEDVEDNENLKLLHLCLKSCINDKNQLYPPTLNHNNIDAKKVIVRPF